MWLFMIYANAITAATSFLSWLSYSGRRVDISYALKNTAKSLGRIATVSLAEMLAVAPMIIILGLTVYAVFSGQGVFTAEYWAYNYFFSLFTPTNLILLLLISLIGSLVSAAVYNYFALALPVAVFDRKHFFAALVDSYHLIKGSFWRLLGIRIAFIGATMLISYSFTGISAFVLGLSTGLSNSLSPGPNGLFTMGVVIQYIVGLATSILIMPLEGIFTAVIFFNQKTQKEGLDLAMQLEVLERTHGI
jgi:hypothetical protein